MRLGICWVLGITVFAVSCLLGSTQSLAQSAYIPNSGSDNVSVIDTATNTVVATIPVGSEPIGVAVSPDGSKVYVTNSNLGPGSVSVIDTATNTVVATIPVGSEPIGVAVSPVQRKREDERERGDGGRREREPDGSKVYVANGAVFITNGTFLPGTVSVIDTAINTVVATIPVGVGPFGVAANPDGSKVYVTNTELVPTNVSVIDTETNTVVATIPVGFGGVGPIAGVAVTPDGSKLYVANTNPGGVSVIDTATNTLTATIPLSVDANAVAVTPDGERVYVTSAFFGKVSVIETKTNRVTATIPVGSAPSGVAVTPDGKRVYVPNAFSNNVSVIDTGKNKVIATIPVSNPGAFGIFIQPARPAPRFAGIPGKANCYGQSVSALAQQYHGLNAAAAAFEFSSVEKLQDAISEFCEA
jgi:YVTN family beta-propeller protein